MLPIDEPQQGSETESDRDVRLALAAHAFGLAEWSWAVETDRITWSDAAAGLLGPDGSGACSLESFLSRIHAADSELARIAFARASGAWPVLDVELRLET